MMRWWVDRGVDGFRMDVINLISKPAGLPDGDARVLCANGPRVHEFLAEMHREVLAGRDLLAVGETPGAGLEDARRYSDPARAEIDMVFTFEHVSLDAGTSKWDLRPLRLTALKANLSAWQDGLAEVGWNSLYWDNHDQPRIVSRWGDDGEHRVASAKTLGHGAAPAARHALRLPGRGAGHDQRPLHQPGLLPRHRVGELGEGRHRRGPDDAGGAARARGEVAGQRPHPDAVGRVAARGLHHRHAVAAGQPQPHRDQRRSRAQGPGLGVPPLPAADRAAARAARRGARGLPAPAARRRAGVRLRAHARRHDAHGAGQPLRLARRRACRAGRGGDLDARPRRAAVRAGGVGEPGRVVDAARSRRHRCRGDASDEAATRGRRGGPSVSGGSALHATRGQARDDAPLEDQHHDQQRHGERSRPPP